MEKEIFEELLKSNLKACYLALESIMATCDSEQEIVTNGQLTFINRQAEIAMDSIENLVNEFVRLK